MGHRKGLAILLACLLTVVGCHTAAPSAPPTPPTAPSAPPPTGVVGGTTPTLAWNPSDGTDPYAVTTHLGWQLCELLHGGLTAVAPDWSVAPLWAESVTQTDGTHLEVVLRADAVFSDGKPMTAAHVLQSFADARQSDAYGETVGNIRSITADDRTLTVTLYTADVVNPTAALSFPIVRREKNAVVGCGRYLADTKAGVLKANPHHPQQPLIKEWKLAAVAADDLPYALASGQIAVYTTDLTDGVVTVAGDIRQETAVLPQLVFIGVNDTHKALKENVFRQGLSAAIDRRTLAANGFSGYLQATTLPFMEKNHTENGGLQENIAQAVAKWKELGYNDSQSGVSSSEKGKLPTLNLLTVAEDPLHQATAVLLCEQWKAAGLTVKNVPLAADEYRSRIRRGNFELYLGELRQAADLSLRPWLTADGAAAASLRSEDAAAYAAYLAGESTVEEYRQQFAESLPFIPLGWRMGAVVCGNALTELSLGGPSFFSGVHSWKWS